VLLEQHRWHLRREDGARDRLGGWNKVEERAAYDSMSHASMGWQSKNGNKVQVSTTLHMDMNIRPGQ
jgi:hypothetical protein